MLTESSNLNNNLTQDLSQDLRLVLDNSSEYIFIKDLENQIVYTNSAFCEFINKDKSEILGNFTYSLFSKEDYKKYSRDDLLIIESKKALRKIIESYTDKFGKRHVIITDKIPVLNEFNEVIRIIVIRKNLEKQSIEVKRLSEKILELNKKIDEFGYLLRHDLLEPVRMISSFIELIDKMLRTHKIKDEKLQKYFSFVQTSCKKMKTLVLRTTKSINKAKH